MAPASLPAARRLARPWRVGIGDPEGDGSDVDKGREGEGKGVKGEEGGKGEEEEKVEKEEEEE